MHHLICMVEFDKDIYFNYCFSHFIIECGLLHLNPTYVQYAFHRDPHKESVVKFHKENYYWSYAK